MTIYENENLYEKQRWGEIFGIPLVMQEVVIRNPGVYHIEFLRYDVTVDTDIILKKWKKYHNISSY